MPQTNPTNQIDEAVKLLSGLSAIAQQYCQDCIKATTECASHPSDGGPERMSQQYIRAARTAVDDALDLQRRSIQAWQSQLPGESGLWDAPRNALAAAESAIDLRTQLWRAWFDNLESANQHSAAALQAVPSVDALKPSMPEPSADTVTGGREESEEAATRADSKRNGAQKRSSAQPSA